MSDIAAERSVEHHREVLIEMVRLHARIIRRMPLVQSVLALCVGVIVVGRIGWAPFAVWCAISVGVEIVRARFAYRVLDEGVALDPTRAHAMFVVLALAAGAAVGGGAAACFPYLPIADQSVLGVVLFAMPAAGVAVSQSSRYIAAAYCVSILFPASAQWARLHPTQALSVCVMTVVYCAFIVFVAVEGEQLLSRSVVIRHQRDRLVRDLEQRNADVRTAMEQAEQAAQSRSRVLATASHDLRQPLHALSIYSAVLAAGPAPEQLREVGANIDQIVRSLGSLLHGLLDLSRLTVGHFEPTCTTFRLDEVIASVCTEYRRPAAEKSLALHVDLAPVRVNSDPVAIGRIVRNLLDNAIKYTERGDVRVTSRVDGDRAVIEVVDSGAGIPQSEQPRIFEEFYRLDNAARDRARGVGLGLAIVKRLCELIGADIALESTPGQGARFRVTLGPVVGESVAVADAADGNDAHLLSGRTVYVLDDDRDILHSTRQLLATWGVRVAAVDTVEDAERLFTRDGAPDLFITDLRLRGVENGAQLIARLRERFAHFPSLVITGETAADSIDGVDALRSALLYKPVTPESLRRAAVRIMSEKT